MSDRFLQHGVARSAAFLAALALVLPPLSGESCACVVKNHEPCHCGHCNNQNQDTSTPAVRTCCARHRQVQQRSCCQRHASVLSSKPGEQSADTEVCHCHHGQLPDTPVVPVNQTQRTVDQLALANGAISTPFTPTNLPILSATSAHQDLCFAADTSLERCVLLSRLTL